MERVSFPFLHFFACHFGDSSSLELVADLRMFLIRNAENHFQGHGLSQVQELHPALYAAGPRRFQTS